MATSFPTYPATTFEQAVELAIFSSNQLHNIINADSLSTVETEDGDIPSIRKALTDNFYFKTPAINWAEGTSVSVFNQLYKFSGETTGTALWYAPTATTTSPAIMGSSPEDDANWKIYGWDTYSKTELNSSSGATYIGTSDGGTVQKLLDKSVYLVGTYEDGIITVNSYSDEIFFNGVKYYVNPDASLPFTTTGTSSTAWEADSVNFQSFSKDFSDKISSSEGITNIGYNSSGLYLGCFFDSQNNNEVFIVESEDGYNWSNPTRLYYQNSPLTVRDPTLIFYEGSFVLLEGGDVDVADCYLYISKDLTNWTKNAVCFNVDGTTPVFSNTRIWSNGGGTVATSKSWAQEPCVDSDGNLCIMSSFYTGVDTTQGSTTDNMFKLGISKCSNWETLTFEYPTLMSLTLEDGTSDIYSRIDPSMHYDESSATYVLGAKRENYGYVELFKSSSVLGPFSYLSEVSPPATATETTMMFEGPSVFGLREGGVGVSVDDYYGGTGQWLVTTTDLTSFTIPESMRMTFARHGSIRYYDNLPMYAEYYIMRSQSRGSTIRTNNVPPKFIHYTESQTLIPVAEAIYWTSSSGLTLTINPPSSEQPRRFYVFLNTGTSTAYTTISGAISGGDAVIGNGVNNYLLVEFIYNSADKKYIPSSRYNTSALYTSGILRADTLRGSTNLDLGYSNNTANSRQITFYPYGSNTSSANINASSGKLSLYSDGKVTLAATTYVDTSGHGYKFPDYALSSLPTASGYQYVELMCTGMSQSTDGTTITPSAQKVYSDGVNWRLSSDPTKIIA